MDAVAVKTLTREELEEAFLEGEASLQLEGMNPNDYHLYREIKEKVLSGILTPKEAEDEAFRRLTND